MAAPKHLRNPRRFHLVLGLVLATAGAGLLWFLMGRQHAVTAWLTAWLVAVNIVAFAYFGFDKAQARNPGGARVPETTLHAFSLAGGSPGAFLAMRLFRHKTMKGRFRILFWCIVVLQTALTAWVIWLYL